MQEYDCNSSLIVACRKADTLNGTDHVISAQLQHNEDHIPYFDAEMLSGTLDIICQNLEWSTPASLVIQIQALYPNVSTNHVHHAWTRMSKTLWRRHQYQLLSAEILNEYLDDVDVINIPAMDGIEQLCWGMRTVAHRLKGTVVEIAINATCG